MKEFYDDLNKTIYQESLKFEKEIQNLVNYFVAEKQILDKKQQSQQVSKLSNGIQSKYIKHFNALFDLGQIHASTIEEPVAEFSKESEIQKVKVAESIDEIIPAQKLKYFQRYLKEQAGQVNGLLNPSSWFPAVPKEILDESKNGSEALKKHIEQKTAEYLQNNNPSPQETKAYFDELSKAVGLDDEIQKQQEKVLANKASIEQLQNARKKREAIIQRIAVTEMRSAYSIGKLYYYAERGYTRMIWNASAEHLAQPSRNKPCRVCFFMHSKKVTLESIVSGEFAVNPDNNKPWITPWGAPVQSFLPNHPYCACTYVPDRDSLDKEKIPPLEPPDGNKFAIGGFLAGILGAGLGIFARLKQGLRKQILENSVPSVPPTLPTKIPHQPATPVRSATPATPTPAVIETTDQILVNLTENLNQALEIPEALPVLLNQLELPEIAKQVVEQEQNLQQVQETYLDFKRDLSTNSDFSFQTLEQIEYSLISFANQLSSQLLDYNVLGENLKSELLNKLEFSNLQSATKIKQQIEVSQLNLQNVFKTKRESLELIQSLQNDLSQIQAMKQQALQTTSFNEEYLLETAFQISPQTLTKLKQQNQKVSGKYNSYLTTQRFKSLETKLNSLATLSLTEVSAMTKDLKLLKDVLSQYETLLQEFPKDLPTVALSTNSPRLNQLLKDYEKANQMYKDYSNFYQRNIKNLDAARPNYKAVPKKVQILERYNENIISLLNNANISSKVRDNLRFIYTNLLSLNYSNYKGIVPKINKLIKELPKIAQTDFDLYLIQALNENTRLGEDLANLKDLLNTYEFSRYNIDKNQIIRLLKYVRKLH